MRLKNVADFLKPHRTVPVLPWTGTGRWDLSFKRVLILIFGLTIFGLGDGLIIQSNLGNAPWSVLAQGLSLRTGLSIGETTLIIGALVLALWIPLRERPGFGTVLNILVISTFIEVGTKIFPKQDSLVSGLALTLLGIAMVGIGSALYITCGLGPGPRDGAMTGLHQRTGVRVARVRVALESVVSLAGWALGGTLGIGTLLFALLIGQSIAISFGLLARLFAK